MDKKPYDDFGYKGDLPMSWAIISLILFILLLKFIKSSYGWIFWVLLGIAGTALVVFIISCIISVKRAHRYAKTPPTEMPPPRDYNEYVKQMDKEDEED